ncbi:hypothetical protein AB8Z38_03050 [Bradyrhizobium sp. LLZ17]|uniref:Uncharacterized protein n=1 Tax=Bradyrhizobium sp. LLZ17 TaxID=3239388 RepID=A0AB39XLY5_9BRAD
MSNILELFARPSARALSSENDRPGNFRQTVSRRQSGPAIHTLVFRSYNSIVKADEAALSYDVRRDIGKARTKLRSIQQQLQRDREHAAARDKLLTTAESKLQAAIAAAQSSPPAPAPLIEPQRRSKTEELEHRREFKAAMRQRIRHVAAARDLSHQEIKPTLSLKHHAIAEFTEKHGVNVEWLLGGKGRVFEADPIVLGPNMTGAELAAVVRTLPDAQKRKIESMVDRILRERGL